MTVDTLPSRIFSKIQIAPTGCWLWSGARNQYGYGRTTWRGRECLVHRLTFHLLTDERFPLHIGHRHPGDKNLDHLCQVPACDNPAHLEPVTHAENVKRSYDRREPDHVDPDSGRRTYNETTLLAALDEMGRQKVRGVA